MYNIVLRHLRHCHPEPSRVALLFGREGTCEEKGKASESAVGHRGEVSTSGTEEAVVARGQVFGTFGAAETEASVSIAVVNVLEAGRVVQSFQRKSPLFTRLDSLLLLL